MACLSIRRKDLPFSPLLSCSFLFDVDSDTCRYSGAVKKILPLHRTQLRGHIICLILYQVMGAKNSSTLPVVQQDSPDEDKASADKKPEDNQDVPVNIVLTMKRRRHQTQKGSTNRHSKKARRTPKAGDGISTGPGFVVPPKLARLRRKSLYKDLAVFICLEELDRSIEEQIIAEGEEDDDLVETWT